VDTEKFTFVTTRRM